MAMEVNGAAILSAIAGSPTDFGMNGAQLNALAMATLLSRLKDKAVGLPHLRAIVDLVGGEDVKLALDHLASKDVSALVKRLDALNPDLKGADEQWQRQRAAALMDGAEPATAAPRAPPAKRPATPRAGGAKTGEVMKSKALKPRASKKAAAKEG